MKIIAVLFLVCGVGLAGGAIFYASELFRTMEAQMMSKDEGPKMVRVLAAKKKLKYGDRITGQRGRDLLRWIQWPEDSVPEGAFLNAKDFLGEEGKEVRIVLRAIEPGELVLKSKVTGFGEGLRLQVSPGMRAVTIPIDAVTGAAGHISPGDRVDIQWTRRAGGTITSTILLWNIPIIALDQSHDTQRSGPRLGRTVTVEVNPTDAQRLRLAINGGTLALLLRGEEDATDPDAAIPASASEEPELIELGDLPGVPKREPKPEPEPEPEAVPVYKPRLPTGKTAPGSQ